MHERYNHSNSTDLGHMKLDRVDDDEEKLCEVAKHPFGIILLYIQVAVGMLGAIGLILFILPSIVGTSDRAFSIALVAGGVVMLLSLIVVILATVVYGQNRLIVTNRNITQILQYGLFNRKVSQLNLVNVEDVTSIESGILATILGYGELKIETAGEQVNFHFTYCPRPSYYAKVILEAREKILGQHDDQQIITTRLN